jgi:hypothetical protein
MHDTAFDHLARAMGDAVSRRGLLRALAGGGLTLGLVGWTAGHDAAAKSCKKIKDKKKRKKCLAKATSPTAQLPAPPPPPVACPSGTFALAGRCAPTCGQPCLDSGGVCLDTLEGFLVCAPFFTSCAAIPKVCSSHADCGAQEFCTTSLCGPNQSSENRCATFLN